MLANPARELLRVFESWSQSSSSSARFARPLDTEEEILAGFAWRRFCCVISSVL